MHLHVDYALVGGGLQNGLLALALRAAQPDARVVIVERGPRLGGNHTWCFHAGDAPAAAHAWLEPLLVQRWDGYEVAFPGHQRQLPTEYACISAERFHAVIAAALPPEHLLCEHEAEQVSGHEVVARHRETGARVTIAARAVIDARGPDRGAFEGRAGYQKFVGLELRCAAPHGVTRPRLMDARVAQLDGFRFFYVLPLSAEHLLIEDTYFSDSAYLDVSALRGRVLDYAREHGWQIAEVLREETGVLPLPWHADVSPPEAQRGPLVAGYQGGWFHAATGYSFPVALRLALAVAATPADQLPGPQVLALWRAHQRQLGFGFRLNWMLFQWFPPDQRYHVLERFYRLPADLIGRFYACDLTTLDRARIFVGRPPRGMSWRAALSLPVSPNPLRLAKEPR